MAVKMKFWIKTSILLFSCIFCLKLGAGLAAKPTEDLSVKEMTIVGEIDHIGQGYIIRGVSPSEIFTILNPVPESLGKYIEKKKSVEISVKIVSGDNVEIVTINGKQYP